jgi:GNAT superfamily N-acetyltransferase
MVDAEQGRRIELSLARSAKAYARGHRALFPEHGAEVLELGGAGGGVAVWGSGFGAPNVSRAFALGSSGEVSADDLSRVAAFYESRGAVARLTTSPWTHPSLFALLEARRVRIAQFDNILVRVLDGAGGGVAESASRDSEITVTRVPPGGAVAWGAVVREGFGGDPDDPLGATIDAVFDSSTTAALFMAHDAGTPAGGGAVDVQDGVAFLFATATLAAHRRRGVHGALIEARLAHARAAGADLAVVVTEPGSASQRNLETRRGFRVGYTETIVDLR